MVDKNSIKKGKKITILGAGNVGASIAYTLTLEGLCSELVLVDINKDKAKGEAMDIRQGIAFCPEVDIRSGDYADAADSDIVIVTLGIARKPGQSRIDLAQINVNIIKEVMPQVEKVAPDAVYIIVSNPVDVLTYAVIQCTSIDPARIIGSGTMLDSSRLRSCLAEYVDVNTQNVHGYVFGEHGDTAMVPWSLVSVAGMELSEFSTEDGVSVAAKAKEIENDVRTAGAQVIACKGATYYAIALSVKQICESIIRDAGTVSTISTLTNGKYGTENVCLSLPYVLGAHGIKREITPELLPEEEVLLQHSSKALKAVIDELAI